MNRIERRLAQLEQLAAKRREQDSAAPLLGFYDPKEGCTEELRAKYPSVVFWMPPGRKENAEVFHA